MKTYVLFIVAGDTNFTYNSVARHSTFVCIWLWHVAQQYTHKIRCCVSTTILVKQMRHNVTLYVHYLYGLHYV